MTINDRISELIRTHKGLTQREMAEYIGVASSTVNNWLKLGRAIPAEYIIPISEFFDVSCEYLLTGEDIGSASLSTEENRMLSLYRSLNCDNQTILMADAIQLQRQQD